MSSGRLQEVYWKIDCGWLLAMTGYEMFQLQSVEKEIFP